MPQSLQQIRNNCAKARESMARARTEHFAFGAFNLDDQATLLAVAQAAAKSNAPVLVEVSQGEVDTIGLANVRDLVDNYKREFGLEIYINLDHSPSVEAAKKGIEAGFEFIHIDVSQANHDATDEEIIAATKEIVEYAKFTGALVESEPHYFGGSSNVHTETINYDEIKKTFSTPEGSAAFVAATGIDTFAAAIGNLHGKYPVPKVLDLELLQRVRDAVDKACHQLAGCRVDPVRVFENDQNRLLVAEASQLTNERRDRRCLALHRREIASNVVAIER